MKRKLYTAEFADVCSCNSTLGTCPIHTPKQPDRETQTLRLIVDLTEVVNKSLDRLLALEEKVALQAKLLDRLQAVTTDVTT